MIKQRFQKLLHKTERGQAIILIAFAIIGLVAMVGLVTDTGILLIEYGKLKRGVDAAAVAAAQQYRLSGNVLDKPALINAAKNFLQLNQSAGITSVTINSCADEPDTFTDTNGNGVWDPGEPLTVDWNGNGTFETNRPALCNPDPLGHPDDNRKLVEVIASKTVSFGFLRVIGIQGTTVTANSTGEAATIDLVLVIDTSASMAFETDPNGNPVLSDPLENPKVCNPNNSCQPMKAVKAAALGFIDTLYFPYDRVAIVTMTSQTPGGARGPLEVLALNSDKAAVTAAINSIKVFEPRDCDGSYTEGSCLFYDAGGTFQNTQCQIWELHQTDPTLDPSMADPSSCPSSNVGGTLDLARVAFTEDPAHIRLDAFWVVVSLAAGPANSTDIIDPVDYPNGFCPRYTWTYLWEGRFCQDKRPSVRHHDTDPLVPYDNPVTPADDTINISYYDPDDYARDKADVLATSISGQGVTIYTIGLGKAILDITKVEPGEAPPAEALLKYIAECAGENSPDDCATPVTDPQINHGQYIYAPNENDLQAIFDRIAQNIATKISQ